jgi:uncharacterized membrane protein
MNSTTDAALVPSTREFTTAWVAYACFALGAALWWPALVGLVIGYVRRGAADAGFLDTHYRWLIRTFWFSLLGYLACLAILLAGVWPLVSSAIRQGIRQGDWESQVAVSIDWSALFATVGGAMLAGIGLLVVWVWYVYRVIRGALRLADARPVS